MSNIFALEAVALTKLLTSCISISTAVNAALVAKPEVLDILLSISVIFAL